MTWKGVGGGVGVGSSKRLLGNATETATETAECSCVCACSRAALGCGLKISWCIIWPVFTEDREVTWVKNDIEQDPKQGGLGKNSVPLGHLGLFLALKALNQP